MEGRPTAFILRLIEKGVLRRETARDSFVSIQSDAVHIICVAPLDAVPLPMLTRTGPTQYAARPGTPSLKRTAQKAHGPVYRAALMVHLTDFVSRLLTCVWPVHHCAHFQVVTVPRQFAFILIRVRLRSRTHRQPPAQARRGPQGCVETTWVVRPLSQI